MSRPFQFNMPFLRGTTFFLLVLITISSTPTISAQTGSSGVSPQTIRDRIQASGLSNSEVRNRLRAAGYSGDLLDPYMGTVPLTASAAPSDDVVAGLSLLSAPAVASGETASPGSNSGSSDTTQIFGMDVFRRTTTEFQPIMTGPVPANYRLGPGDVLVLVITGDTELVHTLEVTRDGFILIPQVGQVHVNSLTLDQLRNTLYDRLGRVYSGIQRRSDATTRFDVTVASLRTNQVFIIGEVERPGAYQLSSMATVLNALYTAGGPTTRGSFRQVEVRRHGDVIANLDLYDYLLEGNAQNDIVLEQGDVVFVPVRGTRATIRGAVLRPAIYELKPGEMLADLVEAAGGFLPAAALDRISISRIAPPADRQHGKANRIVHDIPLGGQNTLKTSPIAIEPGDQVTVFSLPDARRAYVELRGHVYSPGTFGWKEGLRLSELIHLAGGFRRAIYAGTAHIERLDKEDATRKILQYKLPEDSTAPFEDDPLLEEFDIITIYGRDEFRADRTISIAGRVNEPGTYAFREGMTLRDLILKARGLSDGALLDSAEIARLPDERTAGQLSVRIRVALDSTYLFEPESSSYRFLPGVSIPGRTSPEIPLEPFDHVLILKQPEFELQRMVRITGEVAFPGTYALMHKRERISDLIERAGGLLTTGYAPGSYLHREQDNAGIVDVELQQVLKDPTSHQNLILFPGDRLHIPEYNPIVKVVGEVNSPLSVQYKAGANLDYYILSAGGYTRDADKTRVSVRLPNGKVMTRTRKLLLFRSSPKPLPGSTIAVPELRPEDKIDWPGIVGPAAQVIGSVTTVIILLTRVTR